MQPFCQMCIGSVPMGLAGVWEGRLDSAVWGAPGNRSPPPLLFTIGYKAEKNQDITLFNVGAFSDMSRIRKRTKALCGWVRYRGCEHSGYMIPYNGDRFLVKRSK
jgi:hypothetical protein